MGFRPAQSGDSIRAELQNGNICNCIFFPSLRLPVDKIGLPADVGKLAD